MQLAQVSVPYGNDVSRFKFQTSGSLVGDLISQLLLYAIALGGIIFFIKLLMAGFSMLTSAGDTGKIQSATKNLTNALIGLLLVFSTFFIAQIIQVIFGISIL